MRHNPQDPARLLQTLEEEYWDNPPFMQRKDLIQINRLREQLGLPLVDNRLQVIEIEELDDIEELEEIEEELEPVDIHAEARDIYQQYLDKLEMMRPHLEYSSKMIRALAGRGQTPVMPLAKWGTGGGAVLCDHCSKQFPLEGGLQNNFGAGEAWIRETERLGHEPPSNWASFIRGHVTFLQEDNGTFRAYHGYENRGCGGEAMKQDAERRKEYRMSGPMPPQGFDKMMHEYLQDEHSMFGMKAERDKIIRAIKRQLYSYDPGIGVNRPF